MSTLATQIRDAVFTRVAAMPGWASTSKSIVPQLQPNKLPAARVFIIGELMTADGDANAGEPRFVGTVTIGVSVVRGFSDPAVLSGLADADIEAVEDRLFSDPTFVTFDEDSALFEGIAQVKRTRAFPKEGETYFVETQIEIALLTRVEFPPLVPDALEKIVVRTRPPGDLANDPAHVIAIDGEIILPQD